MMESDGGNGMKKSMAYLLPIIVCLVAACATKSKAKHVDSAIGKGRNHKQALESAKAEALRKAFGMYGATVKFPKKDKESFESIFGIKTRYFFDQPTIKRRWQDNAGYFYVEISADVDDRTLFVSSDGYGETVEDALNNAKACAIENAVGVYVSQEIIDEMDEHGSRLREFTRTKAEGYIKHWRRQGSPVKDNSGYHVYIIAEVVPHEVREILKQFKEPGSVLLCLMQQVEVRNGLPAEDGRIKINWAERMLKRELIDEGYKVRTIVDVPQKKRVYDILTKQVDQFLGEASLIPSEESWAPQNRVSMAYLADIIIYGKVDVTVRKFNGMDAIAAEGNITLDVARLGDTGALETIATSTTSVARDKPYIGYGSTGSEAVEVFFNREDNEPIFQKKINELLGELKRKLGNPKQDVVIYATGMTYQNYNRLRNLLSQAPYVNVKIIGTVYAKTLSRITVQLTDGGQMNRLIQYLEELPNCRVRRVSRQEMFIEF